MIVLDTEYPVETIGHFESRSDAARYVRWLRDKRYAVFSKRPLIVKSKAAVRAFIRWAETGNGFRRAMALAAMAG